MRALVWLVLTVLWAAAPLAAQKSHPAAESNRPRLDAGADPNDPRAYYQWGVSNLTRNPRQAAEAFAWASRLDPTWADPLYAQRIALLISDPRRFIRYMEGARTVVQSEEMQRIDSLYYRALLLNPFLHRKLDTEAITYTLMQNAESEIQRGSPGGRVDRNLLQFWIRSYMRSAGPATLAWIAYSEGRFPAALNHYASAMKRERNRAGLHADRARVFFLLARHDSAQHELTLALAQMRQQDDRTLVRHYESKALFEHSISVLWEHRGRQAEAREAYARALQEDLSYYPAHARLGALALAAGDTTTALSEMELAVQIRTDAPALRVAYGQTLAAVGQLDAAREQLTEAVRLEPHLALPHVLLGRVAENRGSAGEAVEHYTEFAERASRRDPQLEWARRRIGALATQGSTAPAGNR
ncbi:MAG: hypothetical protein M3409_04850 [Gemmatimonadota bacterium]|nr:hypothetical protein [Gemmatimonadota bacterium]